MEGERTDLERRRKVRMGMTQMRMWEVDLVGGRDMGSDEVLVGLISPAGWYLSPRKLLSPTEAPSSLSPG